MTDVEPYVDDPREPRPMPRLASLRPLLAGAIAVLLLGSLATIVIRDRAQQDPSLEIPTEQLETRATVPADEITRR